MADRFVVATLGLMAAGCASPGPPFIDQMQPQAESMAARRGQLEMNCPAATGQVTSREMIQPASFYVGLPHADYTVAVSGCGKKATYIVVCPDSASRSCEVRTP
jgi:hypothetical protein